MSVFITRRKPVTVLPRWVLSVSSPYKRRFTSGVTAGKKVERVVIPMMIFVRVSDEERGLPLTLSAISRYMVLRGESVPAVIPDRQMEKFKFMLDYSEEAVELCTTPLAVGEQVRVIKGPLAGLEGELVTVDGKSKVVVRLDMLGYAQVDMPVGFVEKIQI